MMMKIRTATFGLADLCAVLFVSGILNEGKAREEDDVVGERRRREGRSGGREDKERHPVIS